MTPLPLLAEPLLWLTATVGVFALFEAISQRSSRHPLAHPVPWSAAVLIGALLLTGTPYEKYRTATFPLSFMLGPAVVGLAVPIWVERRRIAQLGKPIALALAAGSVTSAVSAVGVLALFGAPHELLATIAPRATTTPVAMAIAAQIGGIPALAAIIVIFAGIFGAMVATPVLNLLRIEDYRARGFAVGVAAHGVGTARAFQVDATAGAMASLGMALNAMATAALLSLVGMLI